VPPVEVLLEILPAAGVSAGVLLVAWLLPRWRTKAWPAAIAVGAGYATSHALARGAPEALPADSTQLLFHFALAGALLGVVEDKLPVAARWAARAVLSAAIPWLLLRGLAEHTWESTTEAVFWYAGLGLGLFLVWSLLEWRTRQVQGVPQPLVFCLVAGGGAAALALGRSGVLGQMGGALSAALGPLVLLALLVPQRTARGAIPVFVLLLAALAMSGHFFAELPAASALLLFVAPLAAVRRWWLGTAVALVLVGVAIYLSYAANLPDPNDPYSGY
jgi:hypothetical protein